MVPAAFFLAKVLTVQRVPKFLSLAFKNLYPHNSSADRVFRKYGTGPHLTGWASHHKQKPKYCEVNVICCNLFWALQPSQSALVGLPSLKWLDFSAKQKNLCFLLVWILDFPDQPCFCTRACLFVGLFNLTKQIPLPSSPHLSNEVYSLGAAPVAVASISWDGQ